MCPNCAVLARPYTIYQQPIEENRIAAMGSTCVDCGQKDAALLKLIHNLGLRGGVQCPIAVTKALSFCLYASEHPNLFILRCFNCQSRFHTSPGRKPKYASEEERRVAQREKKQEHKLKQRLQAIKILGGKCETCKGIPDAIQWNAEGFAPKRSKEWVIAQIIRDPEFAKQYTLFCPSCRPYVVNTSPEYFARAKREEVLALSSFQTPLTSAEMGDV